ncbi:hypothetical protein LZ318_03340 [Saccharopolyspora indica]|uniref:hypothetical protein n=1 Tax=Saccharopolyspora indica TaxID=1229659 RepID=UPI0022EB174B|nr:hypothetical protein [Saccharopolyspora indica]MDA3649937.1 hypothetical protein [Saccharopolyspora indica]
MTTMDSTIETASQSPVAAEHHGDNNYTYNYTYGSQKLLARSRYDSSWLIWLTQVFEPPTGYSGALEKLRNNHRIVITGNADSGLHTAATMLLHEAKTSPRMVTVEQDLRLSEYIGDRTGLLIDLRSTAEMSPGDVSDQLAALEAELTSTESRAVVIVPPEVKHDVEVLRTDPANIVWFDPPVPASVLIKHLEAVTDPTAAVHEAIAAARSQADSQLRALLDGASPNRARALAELIRDLSCAVPHRCLDELYPDIEAGFHAWQDEVDQWYRDHKSTDDRALLVALAALDGAPTFVIAEEAGELVRVSGSGGFPPFDADGLRDRLDQMHAQLNRHRVGFSRPGFADAVFNYVWLDQPWLRRTILEWLSTLPARLGRRLDAELIDALSDRLLAVATEFNDPDVIIDVGRAWASRKSETAARLLTNSALDPILGRRTRAALKDWATSSPTAAVAAVVASVCGGDLAQVDLQLCLTRLRYLAASGSNERVSALGTAAVRTLAEREETAPGVLTRVRSWCTYPATSPARRDGTAIFLMLAQAPITGPTGEGDLDRDLRTCWRHTMDLLPNGPRRVRELWQAAIDTWLDNAVSGPRTDQILAMLVSAAASSGLRVAQLEHATRQWAGDRTDRASVLRDLLTRLRGVDPARRKVDELRRSFQHFRRTSS